MTALSQVSEGIPLRCQRCKHEWHYKGKNAWNAPCSFCRTIVSIRKNRIDGEMK